LIEAALTGWILHWAYFKQDYYSPPFGSPEECEMASKVLPEGARKIRCFFIKDGERQGRGF